MIKILLVLLCSTLMIARAQAETVNWDFEDGNNHGFRLWSVNPATPAADDPDVAGDEAITGVGGSNGLY